MKAHGHQPVGCFCSGFPIHQVPCLGRLCHGCLRLGCHYSRLCASSAVSCLCLCSPASDAFVLGATTRRSGRVVRSRAFALVPLPRVPRPGFGPSRALRPRTIRGATMPRGRRPRVRGAKSLGPRPGCPDPRDGAKRRPRVGCPSPASGGGWPWLGAPSRMIEDAPGGEIVRLGPSAVRCAPHPSSLRLCVTLPLDHSARSPAPAAPTRGASSAAWTPSLCRPGLASCHAVAGGLGWVPRVAGSKPPGRRDRAPRVDPFPVPASPKPTGSSPWADAHAPPPPSSLRLCATLPLDHSASGPLPRTISVAQSCTLPIFASPKSRPHKGPREPLTPRRSSPCAQTFLAAPS
jgi:hypothetical protein